MPTPANASDTYKDQIRDVANAERHADGELIFPYYTVPTIAYSSGDVDTITTSDGGIAYTMTFNYTSGIVSTVVVTDDTTGDTYTQTYTSSGGNITSISLWVRS